MQGTLIAGLSALILKVASMYAFLSYTAAHASTYQAGTQITGIAYVLAALDLTRSLVMITEAGLRAGKIWDEKNHRDINGVLHYTLSFVMRFTVVIMIVVASTNGGFSHSTCNMWD